MLFAFLIYCWTILSTSLATDCPSLWTVYADSCYRFGHTALTFFEAAHYCRQHGGTLVHIESSAENDFLKDHVNYMKGTEWWIGFSDEAIENHWVWYGTNESPSFTDWYPGESNNVNDEDCAVLHIYHGEWHWHDNDCTEHRTPICKRAPSNLEIVG